MIKHWMFRAVDRDVVEEDGQTAVAASPVTPKAGGETKERVIVWVMKFVIGVCGLSLLVFFGLLISGNEGRREALQIFSTTFGSLMGYVMGVNKIRP